MKKFLSASLCLLLSAAPIAAQGKQMVAIYMAGEEPQGALGVHKVLGGELAKTISKSEKYSAVDRTDAILRQLSREHNFQRSGSVSDEQIKDLGKQFGVQYICISEINAVSGRSYYLDVRLVDVVTAEIVRTVTAGSTLKNADEMIRVAQNIAYELIETEKVRAQVAQREEKRERTKKALFYTAVGLDAAGAGLITYGIVESANRSKHIESGKYSAARDSEKRRNAALIAGGALLLSGISIHIFF